MSYLKYIFKPEVYHGKNRNDNFFEGWFYRLSDQQEETVIAVIPGIFKSKVKENTHAFIQVIDGKNNNTYYIKYKAEDFRFSEKELYVKIGNSIFTDKEIKLDIKSADLTLKGLVKFEGNTPWTKTLLSPGIMGWYAYVPFMECNHGIVSLDHTLGGKINYNGNEIDLENGRGYTEKDWGSSFPSSYVWMQSNHFDDPGISFTGSIAKIPWLFSSFRGFIIGMWITPTLYRFTTYTGAKLQYLRLNEGNVEFSVKDTKYTLFASTERNNGGILYGPYENTMLKRVNETLNSTIYVRLMLNSGKVIFEGTGRNAGLDINGNLPEIVDNLLITPH